MQLSQCLQQSFRMRRMNRQEISLIEGEQQRVFVNVQQMFVGSDQQWNFCQRRLRQNFSVVLLGFWNERGINLSRGEPHGDGHLGGRQCEGMAFPDAYFFQGETGDFHSQHKPDCLEFVYFGRQRDDYHQLDFHAKNHFAVRPAGKSNSYSSGSSRTCASNIFSAPVTTPSRSGYGNFNSNYFPTSSSSMPQNFPVEHFPLFSFDEFHLRAY
jgi:hypothetical protein